MGMSWTLFKSSQTTFIQLETIRMQLGPTNLILIVSTASKCFSEKTNSSSAIINDKHLELCSRCFSVNKALTIVFYPIHNLHLHI